MQKNPKEITIKLTDFATIELGYPLHKDRTLFEPYHTYRVYQNPSCTEEAGTYSYTAPIPEQYLTKEGDIILSTAKLRDVVLITKEQEGLLVSDRYLIIRCDQNKVHTGYIRYEMLSDAGCEKRRNLCRDAVLPYQKAKKYADLKIRLPSRERQEIMYDMLKVFDDFMDSSSKKIRQEQEEREKQHELFIQALDSYRGQLLVYIGENTFVPDDSSD